MIRRYILAALVLFLGVLPRLPSQEFPALDLDQNLENDPLTVKLAFFGPGKELYSWWGHMGLVIEDSKTGGAAIFDYGVFSFESESFFRNLLTGKLLYSCQESTAEWNIHRYVSAGRDVRLYTLDLSPEIKKRILLQARWDTAPENRDYYYHFFKDNCATRTRDILAMATEGAFFQEYGEAPGRYTLRQQGLRYTWFSPFFDWLLDFAMGRDIDTPATVWEEMYLPLEIERNIRDFTYPDPGGTIRPLVLSVETVHTADRPAPLVVPKEQWPRALLAGTGTALALILLGLLRKSRSTAGRILMGTFHAAAGFFFGILGSILFYLSLFSMHDYTWHNINLFFINPLLLAAIPLGILLAAGRGQGWKISPEKMLKGLWSLILLGILLAAGIKIIPGFYQHNRTSEALVLPIALVLSPVPGWLRKRIQKKR
ncbi:DUF4105 domain-containing protein [Breznakiella homolactica]|uniref:DUF4105 domain-containing protein n=1 Tax=Breznakiella homolactica TaxID=2798577 RepID=A0A7T8B9X2_9SPIR|nr:DUF4105 domain-containing protein [Breznakiella homolactica]QQO08766.1 DUF4105 domain-containing protein [Breznakiella homolactica]